MTKIRARCHFNWQGLWANVHNRAIRVKGQPVTVQTMVHVGNQRPQSPPLGIERWVHGEGNNGTNTKSVNQTQFCSRLQAMALQRFCCGLSYLNRVEFAICMDGRELRSKSRSRGIGVIHAQELHVWKAVCLADAVAHCYHTRTHNVTTRDP